MVFSNRFNRGQSMVEYVVVTSAIMLALLTPTGQGFIASLSGGTPAEGSFEDAVQDKQRGYTYALSLSVIPETDDLSELADYYDSLGKFPELSAEIRSGSDAMKDFVEGYQDFVGPLKDLEVPDIPDFEDINPF